MILVLVKCADPDKYQCIDHVIIFQEKFDRKAAQELLDEFSPIPAPVIAGYLEIDDEDGLLDDLENRMLVE